MNKIQHNATGEFVDQNGKIEAESEFVGAVTFESYEEASRFINESIEMVLADEDEIDGVSGYSIVGE